MYKKEGDIMKRGKSLAELDPELAKEFCYELNDELTPDDLGTAGFVWWKCNECGHQWKAQIYERIKGNRKCQHCKSLAWVNSDIAKEWCYELNGDLTPDKVFANGRAEVWWECKTCGYRWKATVYSRNKKNNKCKKCKSLATTHPDIVKEWHPTLNGELTPYDVTKGSNKKVWWQCSKKPKHVWDATVNSRAIGGNGCRYCGSSNRNSVTELSYYLALADVFSDTKSGEKLTEQKKEADIYIPSLMLAIEYDGQYYHRTKKHKKNDEEKNQAFEEQGIQLVRIREIECIELEPSSCHSIPFNINKVDSLRVCYDQLLDFMEQTYQEIDIQEKLKKARSIDIYDKRKEAHLFINEIPREKSLGYLFPDLIEEWHPKRNGDVSPYDVYAYTHDKYYWLCPKGHEYDASPAKRGKERTKCPYCYGKGSAKIITFANSVAGIFPQLVKEWHPTLNDLQPHEVAAYSNQKFWWQCLKDERHVWESSPDNRGGKDRGCLYCTGQKVLEEESLEVLMPHLLREWNYERNEKNGIKPSEISLGSNRYVWWNCSKDERHVYDASPHQRKSGRGCAYCAGKRVLYEESLEYLKPNISSQWHPTKNMLKPSEVKIKSGRTVWWKCPSCDHDWEDKIIRRTTTTEGWKCPECN
jgi:very-short-patch-repair endonuclease